MPEYRDPFPDGIDMPGDPAIRLTAEQLSALFSNRATNQRFVNTLQRGIQQRQHPTPSAAPVREGVASGR